MLIDRQPRNVYSEKYLVSFLGAAANWQVSSRYDLNNMTELEDNWNK